MKPVPCPQCGFAYTTRVEEDVDLVGPPRWWSSNWIWRRRHLGRVVRQFCTACETWERQTWT